jgi:GNAT superfamily N-acetyltransferase
MTFLPTSEPGAVEAIAYDRASADLRREFALLQRRVYGEPGLDAEASALHDAVFDVLSFYVCGQGRVLSYAALAMKAIVHDGQPYEIAGLSCVMTDPQYQGRGLGLRAVAAATRCLARSNLDIGLFTCDPPLARFYERAGQWPVVSNVVLMGSHDDAALRSDVLGKVVLMRLLSAKARAAASGLQDTTIDLGLPIGQFL